MYFIVTSHAHLCPCLPASPTGTLLVSIGDQVRGVGLASAKPAPFGLLAAQKLFLLLAYVSAEDVGLSFSFSYLPHGNTRIDAAGDSFRRAATRTDRAASVEMDGVIGDLLSPMRLYIEDERKIS